jgi:hypothetical protein
VDVSLFGWFPFGSFVLLLLLQFRQAFAEGDGWRPGRSYVPDAAALLDPDKLERLGRYDVHLDRKLERMLTMLLRLNDLRRVLVEP